LKNPILTVVALALTLGMVVVPPLFLASGTAFADQADDDFHVAHGDEKRADGFWHPKGQPTDADLERMKTDWDSKINAAEAARVSFIAKGDFSPNAAIAFANQEPIKALGAPMTVTHNPKTLDGTPVGLSIDEPTPPTPTVQPSSVNEATTNQIAETIKVEVIKATPPAKALVSYESKAESKDQK